MEPEFSLALTLPAPGSRRLLSALHEQLRGAIVAGRLRAGTRLPTTRAFAGDYGISRNTALAIYDLLLAEGYVNARGKAGTFVAPLSGTERSPTPRRPSRRPPLTSYWSSASALLDPPSAVPARFEFRLGVPETAAFPAAVWQRLAARAWRALAKRPAAYGDAQGQPVLRVAIAQHLSFARAVACRPDDIVVTAGAQQAFDLLARVLVTPGRTVVALENPTYPPARAAFAAAGAVLVPVPVDGEGLVVDRLPDDARVIYVTPSHQFPLGVAMSSRRRAALLEFARRRGAAIIEDDYDGEFRFGGRPLDALQTLDRAGSVFYVGTFSKSLFPALRLGYVVVPDWARAALLAAKQVADGHAPLLAQDTLAAFIGEGHLARHVRRMRRVYSARRERIAAALESSLSRWFEPLPSIAGLHLAAFGTAGLDVPKLLARARDRDVGLHPLRKYYSGRGARDGIVFGYGAIDEASIIEGLLRLQRVLEQGAHRRLG
jgi:GntR family transcriptional regulator/MocR family aminotransferase